MEICINSKSQKTDSYKTVSQLTIEPYFSICLAHDTIQRLHCVLHYLNMKMREKSVKIIDL